MKPLFHEYLSTPAFSASSAEVIVNAQAWFISIITSEGHAVMTVPMAKQVYKALGRAIKAAEGGKS